MKPFCQFQYLLKLVLRIGVVGAVQAAGGGKLGELLFGCQRVGDAVCFVAGVGSGQTGFDRLEQGGVGHFSFPFVLLFSGSLSCFSSVEALLKLRFQTALNGWQRDG